MTGELFEPITNNSILKHSIKDKKINVKCYTNSIFKTKKSNFNIFDNLFEIRSRTLLSNKKILSKI